jgi:hypothetical protein
MQNPIRKECCLLVCLGIAGESLFRKKFADRAAQLFVVGWPVASESPE